MNANFPNRTSTGAELELLTIELQNRIAKLNDQARIFLPLIAFAVIVAIPIWSRSATRFLLLLVNPFVLLPVGFCVMHLLLAWRGIARIRNRIRVCERASRITDETKSKGC
ncbi:MAG TPA: hypothetical protein VN743_00815 [Blastocatellia bacterium]|nr:hypothetical protein [Blastocatellia bacterium]